MRKINKEMFFRVIIISILFFTSGCLYSEESVPEIIYSPKEEIITQVSKPVITTFEISPNEWVPPSQFENKKRWQGMVIHHSAFSYGCAAHEDKYHKSLGWNGLGYHFVINNGIFRRGYGRADGLVEVGYRWREQKTGSHCRPDDDYSNYWNKHTIGICLIGDFEKSRPTERQWRSLIKIVRFLQERYNISANQVKVHRDVKATKCPGRYFSVGEFRRRLFEQR